MATKKNNVYSIVQLKVIKKELVDVVDYLQALDLDQITDLVDWKVTAQGGLMPVVSSTIEKQIKTAVGVIAQSVGMIEMVYKTEGLSETLSYQIEETTKKLDELQHYYFRQSLLSIEDRRLEHKGGVKKDGSTKIFKLLAASKDDQIQARGAITEKILKIIPLIEKIQEYKSTQVRGGREMDESMEYFMERQKLIDNDN